MLLKMLTILAIALIALSLFELFRAGRGLRTIKTKEAYRRHKRAVWSIGILTVAAVFLVEFQVRMSPNPYASPLLLIIFHIALNVLLVLMFTAIVVRFNGSKHPQLHRFLVYPFFAIYLTVVATGGVMLYELPN